MLILTYQEKLIILISCLVFVVISAIIMACKLAPFCWLYKYCPFKARYDDDDDEDETIKLERRKKQMVYYGRAPPPIPHMKTTYLDDNMNGLKPKQNLLSRNASSVENTKPIKNQQKSQRSSVSTSGSFEDTASHHETTSSSSSQKKSSIVSDKSVLSATETVDNSTAHISFALMYDENDQKLSVFVNAVTNLEPNLLGNANDSFVRMLLIKDIKRRWRQKMDIPLDQLVNAEKNGYEYFEFRTQLIRRNLNPVFNEYFACELKEKDKSSTALKFAVYSVDKFSQQTVVGECQINIGKAATNNLKDYCVPLKKFKADLGEIYLTLTYLPTSQRLNVIVIKACNLKSAGKSLSSLNPFVKLIMVHKGKTVEKHRTAVQFATINPVFNEQITFDLPATEIDKVTLLAMVYHQEAKESSMDTGDESSPSNSVVNSKSTIKRKSSSGSLKKRRSASVELNSKNLFVASLYKSKSSSKLNAKYVCIGKVALGAYCKSTARNHWVEAMCNPRKQIAQVHKLNP